MATIEESEITVATPSGPMTAHMFAPRSAKVPAVVLYSEIFQVTAPIRRMAARLAGQGFLVAVPEVYHEYLPARCVLGYDDPGKNLGNDLKYKKSVAAYDGDAVALVEALKRDTRTVGGVGVMGVCLGGHLALRAAAVADVAACATCFPTDVHSGSLGAGKHDDTLARFPTIKAETLFVFGRQDPHIPYAGRCRIRDVAETSGMNYTWHEFNAEHAFMRDEGHRYDPEATDIVFSLVVRLMRRRLTA